MSGSAFLAAGAALADPIQWSSNGHWYEAFAVDGGLTWYQAETAAANRGGYLATVTSESENAFVYGLAGSSYWNGVWGPWLGGYQSPDQADPTAAWQWVTGETWSWTNWRAGEPNDSEGINEDRLCYFFTDKWNDTDGGQSAIKGYAVEWDTQPIPEPTTWVLFGLGLGALAVQRRVRRMAAQKDFSPYRSAPGTGELNCEAARSRSASGNSPAENSNERSDTR